MEAGCPCGGAAAAAAHERRTFLTAADYSDKLLDGLPHYYWLKAICAGCGRSVFLDLKRMRLRSYFGATLAGLRSRLCCKECRSRRIRIEVGYPPRD